LGFKIFVKKPIKKGFFKFKNELFKELLSILFLVFINDKDINIK